jgi:hypothetical protein
MKRLFSSKIPWSEKTGKKYLSISVKPKVEKPAESERKSPAEELNDQIPF